MLIKKHLIYILVVNYKDFLYFSSFMEKIFSRLFK